MQKVIVYDDLCTLCTRSVGFIRKRDKDRKFLFIPFLSEEGWKESERSAIKGSDSIIYSSGGNYYERSEAIIRILKDLGRGWQLLYLFKIVPKSVRDFLYNVAARHRHRYPGRSLSK